MQFTARDLATLTWIGEQYAVRFDHLRLLLARRAGKPTRLTGVLGPTTTANLVMRWRRAGLVELASVLAHEPSWLWLTRAGLAQVDLAYAPHRPHAAALAHLHAVNGVRLLLEERRGADLRWESERALRLGQGRLVKGRQWLHLPDAVVTLDPALDAPPDRAQRGVRVAIEVELTQKAPERLAAIIEQLADSYTAIWYFLAPELVAPLTRALTTLDAGQRSRVRAYTLTGEDLAITLDPAHERRPQTHGAQSALAAPRALNAWTNPLSAATRSEEASYE